jgi:NAD(P)-dependent dehydrogenase (short-subunit alcohol dehydrogenase family)
MKDFVDKCAVITGGGGLLGRGMATTFARSGMHVIVADLDDEAAAVTAREVERHGRRAIVVATDVTDQTSMDYLAETSYSTFGAVNLLCLNAGLSILKPFEDLTLDDWTRVLSVQLGGVLHGINAFLPRLLAQSEERHIVATASMSGVGRADLRSLNVPYVTAKFAVVGLVEAMAPALAPHGIGVSVLCPGMTVEDPSSYRDAQVWKMPSAQWYENNLLTPAQVAAEVLCGVEENRLYIFPHRAGRDEVQSRHERLLEGFAQAERTSPPMQNIEQQT